MTKLLLAGQRLRLASVPEESLFRSYRNSYSSGTGIPGAGEEVTSWRQAHQVKQRPCGPSSGLPVERDFWPLNTALYVRDFKGNDPRFVSAVLESLALGGIR